MKLKLLSVSILITVFCIPASGQFSSTNDSLRVPPRETSARDRFTLDVGLSPPGYDYQAGWKAFPSTRVGLGTNLTNDAVLYGYFDYYTYHLSFGYGNSGLGPATARRKDYAIYATVHLGGVLVLGSGAYYTTSDAVYWNGPLLASPIPWSGGAISSLRFFYIFGAAHDFRVADWFFVPVGIYVRSSYGDNYGPVFLRLGIGMNL